MFWCLAAYGAETGFVLTRDVPAFTVLGADHVVPTPLPEGPSDGLVTTSPVGRRTTAAAFAGEFVHAGRLGGVGGPEPERTFLPVDAAPLVHLVPDAHVAVVQDGRPGPPLRVLELVPGGVLVLGPTPVGPVFLLDRYAPAGTSPPVDVGTCGSPPVPRARSDQPPGGTDLACAPARSFLCHAAFAGERVGARLAAHPTDCVSAVIPAALAAVTLPAAAEPDLGGADVDLARGADLWQANFVLHSTEASLTLLATPEDAAAMASSAAEVRWALRRADDLALRDPAEVTARIAAAGGPIAIPGTDAVLPASRRLAPVAGGHAVVDARDGSSVSGWWIGRTPDALRGEVALGAPEDVPVDGVAGLRWEGVDPAGRRSWILAYPSDAGATVLQADTPDTPEAAARMRDLLGAVSRAPARAPERGPSVDAPVGLSRRVSTAGVALFAADDSELPRFTLATERPREPGSAAAAALLSTVAELTDLRVRRTLEVSDAGRTWYETTGTAVFSATGERCRVWQRVAFDARGAPVRLVGLAPVSGAAAWFDRFRAAAATFRTPDGG